VSGDPLAKPLKGIDDLAMAALGEISIAVVAFPEAWPIAEVIYRNQCQPSEIIAAGETWIELAGTLGDATSTIDARTDGFTPSAWVSKDRAAFDAHMSDYVGQLYFDQVAALVVGGVTVAVGVMLALLVIFYFVVASILALLAVVCCAALATGVGAALAADCEDLAVVICETADSALTEMSEAIDGLSNTGAKLIGAALALDTLGQLTTGNVDVIKDLVQATVYTSLDTAAGAASWAEQELTGRGIGREDSAAARAVSLGYGTGTTLGGTEAVDLVGSQQAGDAWDQGGDAWKKAR
jgi:hypothetical protein